VVAVLKAASEEREESLGLLFSLTHGTAFGRFAAQIFRALEDEDPSVTVRHPGPVTIGSLKQYAAVQHPSPQTPAFRVLNWANWRRMGG